MSKKWEEIKRLSDEGKELDKPLYPYYLRGYGNRPLKKPKGLKGGTYGPASAVRRIDPKTGKVLGGD